MKTKLIMIALVLLAVALLLGAQQVTSPQWGVIYMTIPEDGTLSTQIQLSNLCTVGAVQIPQVWTEADLTLRGSADGARWGPLRDEYGERITMKVTAGDDVIQVPGAATWTLRYLQFESTVAQGAERQLKVLCR